MKKKRIEKKVERDGKQIYYLIEVPKIIKLLFPIFLKIHKLRIDDTGVFYYLYYNKTHLNGRNIGNIPHGKHSEYTDLCHEKLRRIFNNKELTSLQSANPANKQHEGAIQVNDNLYISIHGLPEGLNQEFAILIAVAVRELDSRMYTAIQLFSQKNT